VSDKTDAKRAQHQRYKEDVKRTGKPFYPHAMFEDSVMSLVVVGVIIGLAIKWHSSVPHGHPTHAGALGPLYGDPADPGTFSFIPRPDWYFYFLFYLLRIFKWPDSVFLGTIGVPTIGLMLLIALPFLDLRRERRLSHRPVALIAFVLVVLSMGTLTWKGATAKEGATGNVPKWKTDVGFSDKAVPGAEIVSKASCLNCHAYDGDGASGPGPDLTSVANDRPRDAAGYAKYVSDPSKFGNNAMPKFGDSLSQEQLLQIGQFLSESKGAK
jgi:ubiquinol-cytochrome c reductase cytochrome b subunit/menaquinol-cytochrome c reductase cytochrome b/c subunit